MPQRCICCQSNTGAANAVGTVLMSPAFSPLKIRKPTATVIQLDSSTECIGPPTIASPKKEPSYEKMGALAEDDSLFSASLVSCATPAASTFIRCQKIAL